MRLRNILIDSPSQSSVRRLLNAANSTSSGSPLIENIFSHSTAKGSFVTLLFPRTTLGVSDGGVFTIGEVPTELRAITDTPRLEVVANSQSWALNMEGLLTNEGALTGGRTV